MIPIDGTARTHHRATGVPGKRRGNRHHFNQKDTGVICIYVAIGQNNPRLPAYIKFTRLGAMDIPSSSAPPPPTPRRYSISPPTQGAPSGEEIRDAGGHACIIYDDLSKHAVAYRELSPASQRPPGREAYPGDVFKFAFETARTGREAFPASGRRIAHRTAYHRNTGGLMSRLVSRERDFITDGQIYLESNLFYSGVRSSPINPVFGCRAWRKARLKPCAR